MTRIAHLDPAHGCRVEGHYTLSDVALRVTQSGDPYKQLTLVDCSGSLRVYVWENSGLLDQVPCSTPVPIHAALLVRRLHVETIANLLAIHALEAHEVANAAALQSWEACPAGTRPALTALVEFVQHLQPDILRTFLNRVLLDPRIASGLTTCKGSQQHHHHEPGGLLAHSVEVMEIVGDMSRARLSPLETSIAQVAALFHDLGKLRTIGAGSVRPVHYLLASHESQTSRLLDPHLEWLRARAPEIAAGLEYTLSYLAQPTSGRGHAHFLAGELISAADRMSAALRNHRRLDDLLAKTLPDGLRKTALLPPALPAMGQRTCR
ncbi:HD domain-containing protein [Metallibacterium sp.]|jgi:3'-5' exoribonuclease|uniref:HD domain-containing protein n=1 Tax=Metallibacterium sp. TaxID=2940281 RepID=UPI00260E7E07|nr:HD domain-containing protein [Metallibacterium sp.]